MRPWLIAASLAAFAAGCIVVQPLDDYPGQSAGTGGSASGGSDSGGTSSGGGKAGTSNVGGATGSCDSNADCKPGSGSEPYMCSQETHKCIKLKTETCPVVVGEKDSFNPNAIVFGAFAPLTTTNVERNDVVAAHSLALAELSSDDLGGLPDGPKNSYRPLVMVTCYNQEDRIEGGLTHLLGALHVPAILATLKPGDLRRAYQDHPGDDVFFLSPVIVTEAVAKLKDDGKVWNMLGQPSDYAPAYASLLKHTEQHLRSGVDVDDVEPIRVAMVTTGDAFDSDLSNKLGQVLTFNDGKSTTSNGKNYKLVRLTSSDSDQIGPTVDELILFRPHIIVSAGSEVVTMEHGVIAQVEGRWNLGQDGLPPPRYILSPFNAGDLSVLRAYLTETAQSGEEDDPQLRFLGVGIAGPEDRTAQFDYEGRLGGMFGNVFADTANYYDSTYLLAYAMYAAGIEQPLSGTSIALGMQRLISGPAIPIGPNDILATYDALSASPDATVEIQSTLGPPSFDASTGVRPIDGNVYCFHRSGKDITVRTNTYRYDPALGDLRADKRGDEFCIPNFFQP